MPELIAYIEQVSKSKCKKIGLRELEKDFDCIREAIIEILQERFGIVPTNINQPLKQVDKQLIGCPTLSRFNEMLLKALSPPKKQNHC